MAHRWVEPFLERRVLVAMLMAAAGLWAFFWIAEEVGEGDSASLDRAVLLLFRSAADPTDPLGPPWLEGAVRDITALGGVTVLTIVTIVVTLYLWLARYRREAVFLLCAIIGAALLAHGIKLMIERPRPDLVPHGVEVYTASFPSGHATGAAATWLTLGTLTARFSPRRRLKVLAIGTGVTLALLIGLSRIYLGVHWPSDVLAGWTLGAAWALFCWAVARALQRRGVIAEPAGDEREA
ncbi:MAG: phosphatase PAP2 family protein [Geminicoccaceae bacterium]